MSQENVPGSQKYPKSDKGEDDEERRSPSVMSQSSVTSGALEWDHTADIGKYKESPGDKGGESSRIGHSELSTIERMVISKSSDRLNKLSSQSAVRPHSSSKGSGRQDGTDTSKQKTRNDSTNFSILERGVYGFSGGAKEESFNVPKQSKMGNTAEQEQENPVVTEANSNKSADRKISSDDKAATIPQQRKNRYDSTNFTILERGVFGFSGGTKEPVPTITKENEQEKSGTQQKSIGRTLSPDNKLESEDDALENKSSPEAKDSDSDVVTKYSFSDANNKAETGGSHYDDGSESPFELHEEDKNSPNFTDAHESAVEDTSNSDFVDARGSITGGEFTDANESISVQYTDSDRSKNTESGGDDKLSDRVHSSPTYTVLNERDQKKRSKDSYSSGQKRGTISSSETSDPSHQQTSSSRQFISTGSQATHPTNSHDKSSESALRRRYRTSSPVKPNNLSSIHDSHTEAGETSEENVPRNRDRKNRRNRGVSDASTDWEYGNEKSDAATQSKSRDTLGTHSDNHSSPPSDNLQTGHSSRSDSGAERTQSSVSVYDWQTSGMTRSEIEYKKRISNSTSTGTSSVIWLELLANQENDLKGDPQQLKTKNRAVQTQITALNKVNKRIGPDKEEKETSTDSFVPKGPSNKPNYHDKNRPTRHDPKPLVTTSSSELSPACKYVEKIVKTSPSKPKKLLKVIDEHRYYHAMKVEKDLRHLHRLVDIIQGAEGPSSSHPSTNSSSTADETDYSILKKCLEKCNREKRALERNEKFSNDKYLRSKPVNHRAVLKHDQMNLTKNVSSSQELLKCREDYLRSKGKAVAVHSKQEKRALQKSHVKPQQIGSHYPKHASTKNQIPSSSRSNAVHEAFGADTAVIHARIDQLACKFDTLADILLQSHYDKVKKNCKEGSQAEDSDSGKEKDCLKGKKGRIQKENVPPPPPRVPPKPAVCFFVPFPNCRGSPYSQGNIDRDRGRRDKFAEKRNLRESPSFSGKQVNDYEESECDAYYEESDDTVEGCSNSIELNNCDANAKSLQEAFQRYHAEFICRASEREAILAQLKKERENRAEVKRDWVRKYGDCLSDASTNLENCLPKKGPRVMTHKEMKQITAKNYKRALEVRERNFQRKQEQERKTNRLMSQMFAKKLRQKALKGDVNILHATSLIRGPTKKRNNSTNFSILERGVFGFSGNAKEKGSNLNKQNEKESTAEPKSATAKTVSMKSTNRNNSSEGQTSMNPQPKKNRKDSTNFSILERGVFGFSGNTKEKGSNKEI